ncbi:LysM peptidoglycan-binding domain-containing protein [Myroides sp. LJL116]
MKIKSLPNISHLFNKFHLFVVLFFSCFTLAFSQSTTIAIKDSEEQIYFDSTSTEQPAIYYAEHLEQFFTKLEMLDSLKQGKINIVHIGDSHIQADFFTGQMRNLLQNRFGNGGMGFAFPYKLARTNGNSDVKYTSNIAWESYRNIFPVNGAKVGLSGIALSTSSKDAVVELSVSNPLFYFSRLKVFTPSDQQIFNIATSNTPINMVSNVAKKTSHTIKSGESLSGIARKYGTTVAQIKKANNLKSDNIVAGKKLSIPSKEMQTVKVNISSFNPLVAEQKTGYYDFSFEEPLSKVYLYPKEDLSLYDLNGIVLENSSAGIIYHSIGVNGARYSDFSKYPLFFEQLKGLEPDLIILSMGTNEAFDKMSVEDFTYSVNNFLKQIKQDNPQVDILLTSPPPSYFSRSNPNTIVTSLSNELIIQGISSNYALWDLYYNLGGTLGLPNLQQNGYLAKDLVHYTVKGYEYSAELFYQALLQSYDQFHKTKSLLNNESI